MNDYDKAGRYMVKRDPARIFPWLLGTATAVFRAWIDARRIALPDQSDLTNDLVAAVEKDGELEAICLELEAEARADAVPRANPELQNRSRLQIGVRCAPPQLGR